MVDRISTAARSALMSRVRGKNTKPELLVRSLLHRMGYRFRIHQKKLPGTPDIVLRRHSTAVFVHGCFWHGHAGCSRARLPETRRDFWESKISRNIARDSDAAAALERLGFRVLVLWECELKDVEPVRETLRGHFDEKAMPDGAEIEDGRP
jgi:DNA mismatch endonuclease, patch repair protein